MKTPILLFGATSILGFNLSRLFPEMIRPYVPPARQSACIRDWPVLYLQDEAWIETQFEQYQPQALIYCHAVCDVRKCEKDPVWAYEMNVVQLHKVMEVLPKSTRLIYVSSDHVFGEDGRYTETSVPCPVSVYGRTRVAAEQVVMKNAHALILRIGLPIGPSANGRTGHLDWLSYRSKHNLPMTIVEDESRSVVCATALSMRVMQFLKSDLKGLRHVTAAQVLSRVVLAEYLLKILGKQTKFKIEKRQQQVAPHLGRVALKTVYDDVLSEPLPSGIDTLDGFTNP